MKIVENSPFCIELVIYKKKLRLANRCTSARKDRQVENKICEHNFCELELRERWISGAPWHRFSIFLGRSEARAVLKIKRTG